MKHLHSTIAIVLLLALVIVLIITLINYLGNKPYNRKIALIGFISAHIQLLLGLVLYFISPLGVQAFSSENMKNSLSRLYFLEHPLMMVIGIVLITIGYSKAKKLTDAKKANQTILIFFGLGLILILSRVPWTTWSLFA
ncbi:hypothetical protein HP439_12155 [Sphingobacterium shayense]|uniref:hypothetical protein n=1 Tax=Sphingobacterium shayense TaxID=626343 RepID=UPI001C130F34|nr:hypothetical protein [Sphingobacterium shayense]NQD71476.1 hypothetical protein [Sphingobacterium shayense]